MSNLAIDYFMVRTSQSRVGIAKANLEAAKRDFGQSVRDTRKRRGRSLRAAARRCKVTPAMLSDFERGRRWSDFLAVRLTKLLRNVA